jgi:hypothetical protein
MGWYISITKNRVLNTKAKAQCTIGRLYLLNG